LLALETERERLRSQAAPDGAFAAADKGVNELHGMMYTCPQCDRLMWQPPGEDAFRIYVMERARS
jgi:hypothetical protein